MNIGENIRRLREAKGLSQEQLAEIVRKKTGRKSTNFISNWENGLNKPDADAIVVLADTFEVDINAIFGWDDKRQLKKDAADVAEALIYKIQSLSDKDKAFVKEMIKRMTGKDGK